MITLIIVTILICSAMSDAAAARDWERSERHARERHEELMAYHKEKRNKPSAAKHVRRRAVKQKDGTILIEEIEDSEFLV